jgi:uncharacterized Ntn-hydrolase superfamily protein
MISHADAGVGAIATQSFVEHSYGPLGLRLMADGCSAPDALAALLAKDADAAGRQVAMVDVHGKIGVHTGDGCVAEAGHEVSAGVSAQANMMLRPGVSSAMIEAYERVDGDLAARLLAALDAAEAVGGDVRGRQSAAMRIVAGSATGRYLDDVIADLRVDDHVDPLGELRRLNDINRAFAGFLSLLATEGLMAGEFHADAQTVRDALAQLAWMQQAAGETNLEPTVWTGVLLARMGKSDEAAEHFERAVRAHLGFAPFIRQLHANGFLPDSALVPHLNEDTRADV